MKRLSILPILLLAGAMLLAVTPPARPAGACCFDDGGCLVMYEFTCTDTWGGRYAGDPTNCLDTDHNGDVDDCVPGPFSFDHPKLYWLTPWSNFSGYGKLQRSDLDGSRVETLAADVYEASSLVADTRAEAIFWVQSNAGIWRFSSVGTEPVAIIGDRAIRSIALDKVDRKVYWEAGSVFKRANYDGSNIEILLSYNAAASLAVVHDPRTACTYVDADADGDVDLYDFAAFQACFSETEP